MTCKMIKEETSQMRKVGRGRVARAVRVEQRRGCGVCRESGIRGRVSVRKERMGIWASPLTVGMVGIPIGVSGRRKHSI